MNATAREWLLYAETDIESALALIDRDDLSNVVVFHCQQSVEKALKAILEEEKLNVPRTHNLLKLFSILPEKYKGALEVFSDAFGELDDVYIDSRYPGDMGLLPEGKPSKELTNRFYNNSRKIYEKVKHLLQNE